MQKRKVPVVREPAQRAFRFFIYALLAATVSACTRSTSTPQIQLSANGEAVEVTGLPAPVLAALSSQTLSDDDWRRILRVSVARTSTAPTIVPPVSGKYARAGDALRFTPLFPLDSGRQYDVVLDPSALPGPVGSEPWRAAQIVAVVGKPAVERAATTVVSHVYPSGTSVPANQLRLYLHFSAPMDWRSGRDHVVLLDDRGEEVVDAFLPLDADFWNSDRTRYTVFFDPGRVKRGILPNRQMGRALAAGKRYMLVVKREWRDGHGQPLAEEFRHAFGATPAIERALSMSDWKVQTPPAGTRTPLVVSFPAALDHGLLLRALDVTKRGESIGGEAAIAPGETEWRFTPHQPWAADAYDLVALEFLEDLAGNRIGRPFEVDDFERTDATSAPARRTLPFRISAATD